MARPREAGNTVICTYRVRQGEQARLLRILDRHFALLRERGYATADARQTFRGRDAAGPVVVDIFTWKSPQAVERAHHDPGVRELWGALEPLAEGRDGRPAMEFPHYARVAPRARPARRSPARKAGRSSAARR